MSVESDSAMARLIDRITSELGELGKNFRCGYQRDHESIAYERAVDALTRMLAEAKRK